MKQFKLLFVVFTLFLASVSIASGSSYQVTTDLNIRAVINTVEAGDIDAVWYKGGEDTTTAGDRVIWGYFYASPSDVNWGSENNPDLYVKIWFDRGGRIDVNFFHVSVPDIEVYSEYSGSTSSNQYNKTTMANRYYRHEYNSGTSACSDVSGTWSGTETVDLTNCGPNIFTETYTFTVTQNGCNLVFEYDDDNIAYAVLNGNKTTFTTTWYEDGGTVKVTGIYTLTFSGNSYTGSSTMTVSGPRSCSGSSTEFGSKQ